MSRRRERVLISPYPAGLYAIWSGTSASAALVSGEAALLFSQKNLKSNDVAKRIADRVDPLRALYDLGKGRINLKDALKK
jgi:subtilisin family serine protease